MRTVACVPSLALGLVLTLTLAGCAQRVDAWVRADAISSQIQTPDQMQNKAQVPSYVLLAPPLCGDAEAWEEVRDLLRPALVALGYVPHLARAAVPRPATARDVTDSTGGMADAGARRVHDADSPSELLSEPSATPDTTGQRPRRKRVAASGGRNVPLGADNVPHIVVRVHWDTQGPFLRYVPVLRSPPGWYGPYWGTRWGRHWYHDPFYPYAYVVEDFYVRRLLVEAVRNTSPAPELAAPLTLTDALLREDDSTEPLLWRVQVESVGTLSHAERVLTEMMRAALPWLGKNARAQMRVRGEVVQVVAMER